MRITDLTEYIEKIASKRLALDWDNTGLLVGDAHKKVKNILLTIDVTAAVIAEADKNGTDLILSYHPVIWDGLKTVTPDGPGSAVYELIKKDIAVYSIHTAFDIVEGGVNDLLAEMIGINAGIPIGDFVDDPDGPKYKFVVFVPADSVNDVAEAIFDAGAGAVGNYTKCAWRTEGTGSFLPGGGANPAVGKKGRLEYVNEIRLEAIVPACKINNVVSAMRKAHPYEEPAFDVLRHFETDRLFGLGRMGELEKPATVEKLIERIRKTTGAEFFGIVGPKKKTVKKAAVCAGSCGKIINTVISSGCDFYLTGEIKHHQAMAASEAGVTVICLSHSVSERFALKKIAKRLQKDLDGVTIRISKKDKDPFVWKAL